jgi:hypothetical protein
MTVTAINPNRTQLNSAMNDYTTDNGVRVCSPLYLDIPVNERKALLNLVRHKAMEMNVSEVKSKSGISVATSANQLSNIEAYLGCSLEVLRSLIFSRGGLSADLVLKLQALTDYEVISIKEIEAGLKNRLNTIKEYVKNNPYTEATPN